MVFKRSGNSIHGLRFPYKANLDVKQEVKLAQKRMRLEGRKDREPFTKSKLKKIFTSWHIYLLTILYMYVSNPPFTETAPN
jgi:hypothetical protein